MGRTKYLGVRICAKGYQDRMRQGKVEEWDEFVANVNAMAFEAMPILC